MSDQKKRDLETILAEAKAIQDRHAGQPMPADESRKFDALCQEAEALQAEADRHRQLQKFEQFAAAQRDERNRGALVPDPIMPKRNGPADDDVTGYMTLGDYAAASAHLKSYVENGAPRGTVITIQAKAYQRESGLIAINRKELGEMQQKAVPNLGARVIPFDRVDRIPQVTGDDRLTLNDLLSQGTTTSDTIEYVREESFTNLAAETAHGNAKPESAVQYTLQTAPVRTIAHWMPVQTQQLADWSALRGLIDNRLRYGVGRRREGQFLYGGGTPPDLRGILSTGGVQDIALNGRYTGGTHTIVDAIRMGMTDVFVAGYSPNGLAIHPFDWESVMITKGQDEHYLAQIFPAADGTMRVWGLRVVEVEALQAASGERHFIVGDWTMGATAFTREGINILVGTINEQFIENVRTILAEERCALAVFAPAAFAEFETQAAT